MLALALVACAPSSAEISRVHAAVYATERENVWEACDAELRSRFGADNLRVEDREQGVIETGWRPVYDGKWHGIELYGVGSPRHGVVAPNPQQRVLFRALARIVPGGPRWRIEVDGQAALYRAGLAALQPYAHGAIDEPEWVPDRIAAIAAAIYERLKDHAMDVRPQP